MAFEVGFDPGIGGKGQSRFAGKCRSADGRIAALAERQHGTLSRSQLLALGLGRGAIDHRLERGRLHPLYRGVYAVGHRSLSREGRWMAAVLAGGPGAVLSHRTAAVLWGLRGTARARTEVTAPVAGRSRLGIEFHRGALTPEEITTVRNIPVTTAARTLLDLAAVVSPSEVERAINEAEVLRLADAIALADLVARHPGRRGIAAIRSVLAVGRVGTAMTRSELEDRFLAFVAASGLPRPETNVLLEAAGRAVEVDCVWRAARLVVELDGRVTHATRAAFERDRARDRILQAAGWRVVRLTWRQLHDEPTAVEADLRALLDQRRRASQS